MAEVISYSVQDGVAFLTVAHPPVNALSRAVRAGLMEAMDRAEEDDTATQIVLIGDGGTFPAGAEIAEFDEGLQDPSLRDLCERVEYSEKPVIAALSGTAYGGGFELALAAHYRVALRGTRLSLPEVRLGLPPSAGATQRLPRLAGAALALDMLLTAKVLPVDRPPGQGLVDAMVEGDLVSAVRRFCMRLRAERRGVRRLSEERGGFADMAAYTSAVEAARKTLPKHPGAAPNRILSLVEAAPLLPFEAGLAMEQDAFEDCLASDTAKALRHAFVAELRAARFSVKDLPPLPTMKRIAVLGGGPLAVQVVLGALNAGVEVNWGTRDAARLGEGVEQLKQFFAQGVRSGGLTQALADQRLTLLRTGGSAAMVEGSDMILHVAPGQGNVPAPKSMVRAVVMTSRVDELGLRFPPPVFQTRLVEIIEGPGCRPEQIAAALALAQALGKVPVHVRSRGDSIAGRLGAALQRAADGLVDMGADPYQIDRAVQAWGWAFLPFQSRDGVGLDDMKAVTRGEGARNWAATLVAAGRKGRASGLGFYRWSDTGPEPDAALADLLNAAREPKTWTPGDIMLLLVGALANEGARMLASDMARRATDIDVAALLGMQFPRWRGGPMKAASQMGLFRIQTAMDRLGHPDTAFWKPEPLWTELVKNGRNFDAL